MIHSYMLVVGYTVGLILQTKLNVEFPVKLCNFFSKLCFFLFFFCLLTTL